LQKVNSTKRLSGYARLNAQCQSDTCETDGYVDLNVGACVKR